MPTIEISLISPCFKERYKDVAVFTDADAASVYRQFTHAAGNFTEGVA
jgi:hypothetical protein